MTAHSSSRRLVRHVVAAMGVALLAPASCAFPELSTQACLLNDDPEPDCASCENERCCDEVVACQASPDCSARDACLQACGPEDAMCRTACNSAHPPDAAAAALSACRTSSCSDSCATCGGYFATPTPTCDACLVASCCAEQLACHANANCREALKCREACAYPGCTKACGQANIAGSSAYEALLRCLDDACFESCEVGTNYTCQGAYERPAATTETVAFNEFLFSITNEPLVGVTVRACVRADFACDQPVDEAVTDTIGGITLSLPTLGNGFDGYLTYEGAGVYPARRYPSNPFVSDAIRGGFFPIRVAELNTVLDDIDVTEDLTRGHIFITAGDCLDGRAGDVEFSLGAGAEEGTTRFYFVDGLPVFSADKTDSAGDIYSGIGGFMNVLPGTVVVRAHRADDGALIDEQTVVVRAAELTYSRMVP